MLLAKIKKSKNQGHPSSIANHITQLFTFSLLEKFLSFNDVKEQTFESPDKKIKDTQLVFFCPIG